MFPSRIHGSAFLALLAALALVASPAAAADKTGSITGKVTLLGKPVTDGKVSFHPAKGKAVTAKIEADGTYSAKAVPVGEVRVTIEGKGVPKKYASPDTSGLTLEVKEGKTNLDFDLR